MKFKDTLSLSIYVSVGERILCVRTRQSRIAILHGQAKGQIGWVFCGSCKSQVQPRFTFNLNFNSPVCLCIALHNKKQLCVCRMTTAQSFCLDSTVSFSHLDSFTPLVSIAEPPSPSCNHACGNSIPFSPTFI